MYRNADLVVKYEYIQPQCFGCLPKLFGKIKVCTYNIILEDHLYRLLSAIFYDPGFDLRLS